MMPSSSNQECHICLEELRTDLVTVPCGHVYHHTCIIQALQVNRQCPICRRSTSEIDVIALYFDVSTACDDQDGESLSKKPVQAPRDNVVLSSRINTLMERVQWQKKQQERLIDKLRRVRSQSEHLLYDKEILAQRIGGLEATKSELQIKVARYQMELSQQAEAARRSSVNQSIIQYLETCDASALEEEIQNPSELIMALKKACKFRHDQYEKVVKEKMRLKEILRNVHSQFVQQQVKGNVRLMESTAHSTTSTAFENKHACSTFTERMDVESKKRKFQSPSILADMVPFSKQRTNDEDMQYFHKFAFRAKAYSDLPIRPPPNSRQVFGRSNLNPNQHGAFNLTPSSHPPVLNEYDEADKLTTFLFPNVGDTRSGSRKKFAPSIPHLLNAQPRTSSQQQQRIVSNRQQYALTNWLRNN